MTNDTVEPSVGRRFGPLIGSALGWLIALPVMAVMAVVMAVIFAKLAIGTAIIGAIVLAFTIVTAPWWGSALIIMHFQDKRWDREKARGYTYCRHINALGRKVPVRIDIVTGRNEWGGFS